MNQNSKRGGLGLRDLVVLGVVAGSVVACGGKAAEMMGDVLEDAGSMVSDAGTQLFGDAGGALADAGRGMRDGSTNMTTDAKAQDVCATCTSTGAQRTILASEDPDQLVGTTVAGKGWTVAQQNFDVIAQTVWFHYAKLADGPLLVTDVQGITGAVGLYAVAAGKPCVETTASDAAFDVNVPKAARAILSAQPDWQITGARYWIKASETLCAWSAHGVANGANVPSPDAVFVWSGFHPYQ